MTMTIKARRIAAMAGGVVAGLAAGNMADAAGVTPQNSGDMTAPGFFLGLGLGLMCLALLREDSGD